MSSPQIMQPSDRWRQSTGDQFLTPIQQNLYNGYLELKAEAERQGPRPASVISLLPFSFPVTGPIHQVDIRIPCVPLDREVWERCPKLKLGETEVPYVTYIFNQWKPLQQKYLVGQLEFEPVERSGIIWPLEQAADAVVQNSLGADRGGVFCYAGEHLPFTKKETAIEERALAERAFGTMMRYCTDYLNRVSDAYMSRQTTSSWKDLVGKGKYHRWIAQYLFNIGSIREYPSWYQEVAAMGGKHQPKCDQCKQNIEPDAPICRHCHRVLLPYEAFSKLMIDADTPGAKLAAKRLSNEELDKLMKAGTISQDWLEENGVRTKKPKPNAPNA